MDSSAKNPQEFEPRFDWIRNTDSHVLIVHLPGFRSNQLKVQVTSVGKLRISGERKLGSGKLLRFQKEFEVSADVDADKIHARFEDGVLYVRQPKKTVSPDSQDQTKPPKEIKPPAENPKTAEKPAAGSQSVRENAAKNVHDKPRAQANGKRTAPSKPQEPTKPKEETKAPSKNQKTTEKPSAGAPSVQEVATKNGPVKQTAEEAPAKTPQMEKEPIGSKKEKKEDEKDEEKKRQTNLESHGRTDEDSELNGNEATEMTGDKAAVKLNGGGIFRQGIGCKQVVDEMVKEMKSKVGSLILSVVVFVIFYVMVNKKQDGGGEL